MNHKHNLALSESPSNVTIVQLNQLNAAMISDGDNPDIAMENLYPALIQCFSIITIGYMAGRFNVITNSGAKGFNTYVGTFALPSIIFMSLYSVNWDAVNWMFLLAILISKSIAFFSVLFISLLVVRPFNLGKSAILAIFCTQSNDFAIGYPIVDALYSKVHPDYAAYIYLVAPISLAILNPISYVLLEISNLRTRSDTQPLIPCQPTVEVNRTSDKKKRLIVIVKTIKSIIFNPILLMTLLGVLGKFVFPHGLPVFVNKILTAFANSFAASALFLLGVRMVGKAHKLQGSGFLLPGILIIVKLLVLPLVIRQTVNIINAGGNFTETTDLSTFGFLYGTFPSAPGVFVVATQYNTDIDLVASAMVACTFISAPLMFISAKMISITKLNPSDYLNELDKFAFDISIAAICSVMFVLVLFYLTKKFKRMPHRITCCLLIAQLIGSIGVILWSKLGQDTEWKMYLQFGFFAVGQWSSRLFTAFLAITLLFLSSRSLCFVLKLWPYFLVSGYCLPILLSVILLIFDHKNILPKETEKKNPNFQFGRAQAAITVFLLVCCFLVTVGCLILHQRYKKKFDKYVTLSKEVSTTEDDGTGTTNTSVTNINDRNGHMPRISSELTFGAHANRNVRRRRASLSSSDDEGQGSSCQNEGGACCSQQPSGNGEINGTVTSPSTVLDIEDLLSRNAANGQAVGLCSTTSDCAGTSRQNCQSLLQRYQEQSQYELEPIEYDENTDLHQSLKHTVLLILLLCSMFVSFALTIWTLIMDGMSGIYVELAFLDGFLNFGQSLIVLACFISDTGDIVMPIIKQWRKIWYGANILKLPSWEDLSNETKHVCEQFKHYHLETCRRSIAKDKRWRMRTYRKVFYGNIFVDWLIEVGLAQDRAGAVKYGRKLVEGRILRHINNVYHFDDKKLLYTFCNKL